MAKEVDEFIMANELNKRTHMDKYIIRSWSKDDFFTLAKYLNNKKIWDNCRDSLPYPPDFVNVSPKIHQRTEGRCVDAVS